MTIYRRNPATGEAEKVCTHHDILDAPSADTEAHRGVCKRCGRVKLYPKLPEERRRGRINRW